MPSPPGVQISTFGRLSALPREAVGCLPGWFQLKARSQSRTLWCLPGALHGDGLDYSAVSIDDLRIGRDLSSGFKALEEERAELIARRLRDWKSAANAF